MSRERAAADRKHGGRIRVLSDAMANRIAAGEVVERPASIVKELLENALDAGATRVAITIDGGGKELIRIEDDGHGILPADVPLAFERHATSKLAVEADLDRIVTLGFRGEALPSIASVARLTLTTLSPGEAAGTRIAIAGGKFENLDEVAFAAGTTIEVRELFFNTPARRKFLKSPAAETAACVAVVIKTALAHPDVHFILTTSGKQRFACPKAGSPRERVGQLFGRERADRLLAGERVDGPARVAILADVPAQQFATRNEQYVFVNRRPIVDRSLQYAITRAYDGLLSGGRFPSAFVYLEVEPTAVDVNVHPAKTEVRFADPRAVQGLVAAALREALARASYVPALLAAKRTGAVREAMARFENAAGGAPAATRTYHIRPADERPRTSTARLVEPPLPRAEGTRPVAGVEAVAAAAHEPGTGCAATALPVESVVQPGDVPRVLGQFRNTFIVAWDSQGLVLADQHTAHERVLFDRLQREGAAAGGGVGGGGGVQRLLMPQLVEIPATLAGVLDEAVDELGLLGVEVEPMGGTTFAVRSLPAGMTAAGARGLVLECLAELAEGKATVGLAARRDKVLATVACHAAVKVNMPLSNEKAQWILQELMLTDDPFRCPHGRATLLRMDEEAIKRSFKRYW